MPEKIHFRAKDSNRLKRMENINKDFVWFIQIAFKHRHIKQNKDKIGYYVLTKRSNTDRIKYILCV